MALANLSQFFPRADSMVLLTCLASIDGLTSGKHMQSIIVGLSAHSGRVRPQGGNCTDDTSKLAQIKPYDRHGAAGSFILHQYLVSLSASTCLPAKFAHQTARKSCPFALSGEICSLSTKVWMWNSSASIPQTKSKTACPPAIIVRINVF